jgi:hypothetical protein
MNQEERRKLGRRNFFIMICEGSLFWMAVAFIEPTTVVAVFIEEYTGSMELAGLSMALRQAANYVGMLIMGMYIHKVHDNGAVFRKWALWARSPLWLIIPALLLGLNGAPMVLWFILLQTSLFFIDGFMGLCWQRLNANTISSRDRGPIQGYQQVVSAVVGLASAFVIKLLMDSPLEKNVRYALIFGCCALIFVVNALVLRTLRDAPPDVDAPPPPRSFSRYIGNFLVYWKASPAFRKIMYGRVLYAGGIMATSLLLLFGKTEMGLTDTQVSTMIYVQVGGQLVGGLVWGNVSRYLGNARTCIVANIPTVAVAVIGIALCLFAQQSPPFIAVAVMVFLAASQGVAFMGYNNSIYDRLPREHFPAYMVLQQIVLLPFTALPYLAGLIAQTMSFLPLFALVAAFGVGGIVYGVYYARDLKAEEAAIAAGRE